MTSKKVLVFGGEGTIGSACVRKLGGQGFEALPIGRDLSGLKSIGKIRGAVWAQGANFTGNLMETSAKDWDEIWQANFTYVIKSLRILTENLCLGEGTRLVVVSSVWQEIARSRKVAYIASKAALGGLVRGLAADLGDQGIAINAVLPGVVNSEMTEKQLSKEQIKNFVEQTPGKKLATPEDVANTVTFLISDKSAGINGQSIIVDRGWSITRDV